MPGLNFGTYGGVGVRAQADTAPSGSVSQAAFGPGYTSQNPDGLGSALTPNDAFGTAFWIGLASLAALVLIRQSLPR